MTEDTTPEPLNLDTAALRERGPYITSMASDGYPIICVDTDSWNAMCAEVDRLRAALSAAVGVKAAPTKTTHKFLLGNDETGACRSTVIRVVAGFRHTVAEYCGQLPEAGVHQQRADPVHVQQPAEGDDEFVCEPDCGFDDCAVKAGRCCWQGHQDTADCSKGCCLA